MGVFSINLAQIAELLAVVKSEVTIITWGTRYFPPNTVCPQQLLSLFIMV